MTFPPEALLAWEECPEREFRLGPFTVTAAEVDAFYRIVGERCGDALARLHALNGRRRVPDPLLASVVAGRSGMEVGFTRVVCLRSESTEFERALGVDEPFLLQVQAHRGEAVSAAMGILHCTRTVTTTTGEIICTTRINVLVGRNPTPQGGPP
jgi:hypothetical protein